jgi:hypothetical protein
MGTTGPGATSQLYYNKLVLNPQQLKAIAALCNLSSSNIFEATYTSDTESQAQAALLLGQHALDETA